MAWYFAVKAETHALCDDEVTLTANQDIDSKVKLAGGEKRQTNLTAKSPVKIINQCLIYLVVVKNQVYETVWV